LLHMFRLVKRRNEVGAFPITVPTSKQKRLPMLYILVRYRSKSDQSDSDRLQQLAQDCDQIAARLDLTLWSLWEEPADAYSSIDGSEAETFPCEPCRRPPATAGLDSGSWPDHTVQLKTG